MITSSQAFDKFGDPAKESSRVLWDVPPALEIGVLPNSIYCNKLMVDPLTRAFGNIIDRGLLPEVKTWDGCFQIRKQRGAKSASLHSWGLAVDLNAAWNQLGKPPTMSKALVRCFTDAGLDWGGTWKRPDGMHFQLRDIV